MAIRAALFDMDGTLIGILDLWRGLLACYLKPLGAALSEEQFRYAMTLPYDGLAVYMKEQCGLSKTPQEIMEEIDQLSIKEYAGRATLKNGVSEVIHRLYAQGLALVIVTTNLGEIARLVLERFGLASCFSHIFGTHELHFKKVFPECFLDISERIGVSPEDCIVFEDSPAAVQSAKLAGMRVVGVLGEQTDKDKESLKAIADMIIDNDYEGFDLKCQR